MYLIEQYKQLKKEAELFWKDESNSLEDRIKVFNCLGDYDLLYPDTSHPLSSLFEWYNNHFGCDRYRLYTWEDIISTYLDEHSDRPKEIIDRVYDYLNKLMIKGEYKGFRYEW